MLEVGNGGMTDLEYRTHFALWSMMAAPLLIGTDLRRAMPATMAILTNTELIALDQDKLGKQAQTIADAGGLAVFAKPLADGDVGVALYNETDAPASIRTDARSAGLPDAAGYLVRDLWQHTTAETAGTIAATVPAHGAAVYRVSVAGRDWRHYPPLTQLSATLPDAPVVAGQVLVRPGEPIKVRTSFENDGRQPALNAAATLAAPDGWSVAVNSKAVAPILPTGQTLTTQWTVTPPPGVAPGTYRFTAGAVYTWAAGKRDTTSTTVPFLVAAAPPAGTTYLSDLAWLSASNGWGPVEKDMSNGETAPGDGHTITINGATYPKGLGTNAPSEVDYYIGGTCNGVQTDVGLDDEKDNSPANATFQIYADSTLKADSGPMASTDPPKSLTADLTGAQVLRLVVNDNGTPDSDHADWAGARINCS